MEQTLQNQSIVISQSELESLPWRQLKYPILRNQEDDQKNVSNKERLRKLSEHDFVQEIKLLEKRVNSRFSAKIETMSQSKLESDLGFRSVKQRILRQQRKRRQRGQLNGGDLFEPEQLQDLGYLTFKIVKLTPKNISLDAFVKQKKQKKELKQLSSRRKVAGF